MITEDEALAIVVFDGGGIRGLSSLIILRNVLHRLQQAKKLDTMPLPCEVFSMISGTSTGGLIALMLGRLRMSVEEAINTYELLPRLVFSDINLSEGSKFKATKLDQVMKDIAKWKTGDEDTLLMDKRDDLCHTFVCAMNSMNMNARIPQLFRTYPSQHEESISCTIWQAGRATTAAPTFFDPIQIGTQRFIDGGIANNNPTLLTLEEVKSVFPGRKVACILSLGTGKGDTISIPDNPSKSQRVLPIEVIEAMQKIATDCEHTHEQLARRFRDCPRVYFRLNVEQGMQSIRLSEWEMLHAVEAHSRQYLKFQDVDSRLAKLSDALATRARCVLTEDITGDIRSPQKEGLNCRQHLPPGSPSYQMESHEEDAVLACLQTSKDAPYTSAIGPDVERQGCTPGTRCKILAEIMDWAESPEPTSPLFWLYSPAGIGKTAIALTLCENLKEHGMLASSYFCSIQSDSRNSRLIVPTIACQLASNSQAFAVKLVSQLRANPGLVQASLKLQIESILCVPWKAPDDDRAMLSRRPLVVVIDALSECNGGEEFLSQLLQAVDRGELQGMKFFVTSRHVPALVKKWQAKAAQRNQIPLLDVDRDVVDGDIHLYLQSKLAGMLSPLVDFESLVSASGGLFIFAATVVKYLSTSDTRLTQTQKARHLKIIFSQAESTVRGIDDLCARVVNEALSWQDFPPEDELNQLENKLKVLHDVISLTEHTELDLGRILFVISAAEAQELDQPKGELDLQLVTLYDQPYLT